MVKALGAMTRIIQNRCQHTATHQAEATVRKTLRSIGHRLPEAPALQMITGTIPNQHTTTEPEATICNSLRTLNPHIAEESVVQSTKPHALGTTGI